MDTLVSADCQADCQHTTIPTIPSGTGFEAVAAQWTLPDIAAWVQRPPNVVQPLMVPFFVMMIHEIGDSCAKMPLAKQHHAIEALGFCREHKALGEGQQ